MTWLFSIFAAHKRLFVHSNFVATIFLYVQMIQLNNMFLFTIMTGMRSFNMVICFEDFKTFVYMGSYVIIARLLGTILTNIARFYFFISNQDKLEKFGKNAHFLVNMSRHSHLRPITAK